jgi:hypothetical protein
MTTMIPDTLTKCHTLALSILTTDGVVDYTEIHSHTAVLLDIIARAMCKPRAGDQKPGISCNRRGTPIAAAVEVQPATRNTSTVKCIEPVSGTDDDGEPYTVRGRKKRRYIADSSDEEFSAAAERNGDESPSDQPTPVQEMNGQFCPDIDGDKIIAYTADGQVTCFEDHDVHCIVNRGVVVYPTQCVCIRLASLTLTGSDTYHPVIVDRLIPSGIVCRWFLTDKACVRQMENTPSRRVCYDTSTYEVGYTSIVSDLRMLSRAEQESQMSPYRTMLNCWWQDSRKRENENKWTTPDYIALHISPSCMRSSTKIGKWARARILVPLSVYGTRERWDLVNAIMASTTTVRAKKIKRSVGVCGACQLDRVLSRKISGYTIGNICSEKAETIAMLSNTLREFRAQPYTKESALHVERELLRLSIHIQV